MQVCWLISNRLLREKKREERQAPDADTYRHTETDRREALETQLENNWRHGLDHDGVRVGPVSHFVYEW